MDAKKSTLKKSDALELARKAQRLYSARGTKIVELDLRQKDLKDEEILALMMGPTGNLRAPTFVTGKTVVVGFHPDVYKKVL